MFFKFKEGEESKPVKERVIERTGDVVSLTLLDVEGDIRSYEKTLKELKANRGLKKDVIDNVVKHHPFVADMPEVDRIAVHLYHENATSMKMYDSKIAEIEADYAAYLEWVAEMKAQLPELNDVPSPYVAPENNEQKD